MANGVRKHPQYLYVSDRLVAATNIVMEREGDVQDLLITVPLPYVKDESRTDDVINQLGNAVGSIFDSMQEHFGDLTGRYQCFYTEIDEDDVFTPGDGEEFGIRANQEPEGDFQA